MADTEKDNSISIAPRTTEEKPADSYLSDDLEKHIGETTELKRRLKARHLSMIAIGGTIGTGLFIGSGEALAKAGPAGALIAYIFVGTIVYSVMLALGEMATYIPVPGAFSQYASRFVDPSLGFAMGWIYWFSWAITYALELTASGLIIQYWRSDLNIGIFLGPFWAIITAVNFLPVSFYGEIEFYFAMIKVLTVIGFVSNPKGRAHMTSSRAAFPHIYSAWKMGLTLCDSLSLEFVSMPELVSMAISVFILGKTLELLHPTSLTETTLLPNSWASGLSSSKQAFPTRELNLLASPPEKQITRAKMFRLLSRRPSTASSCSSSARSSFAGSLFPTTTLIFCLQIPTQMHHPLLLLPSSQASRLCRASSMPSFSV